MKELLDMELDLGDDGMEEPWLSEEVATSRKRKHNVMKGRHPQKVAPVPCLQSDLRALVAFFEADALPEHLVWGK